MTNKELKKKIEKIIEYIERHTEEGFGLSFENANKAEAELMDLIKEVCKSIIPEGYTKPENTDFGYELCRTDIFENIYELFEDENGHEIQK